MAIQISENNLSPKARKALANAKNKSQLLRDALEFYVNRDEIITSPVTSIDSALHSDIKEIKELLKGLSLQGVVESVASKEIVERKISAPLVSSVVDNPQTELKIADSQNDSVPQEDEVVESDIAKKFKQQAMGFGVKMNLRKDENV